MAKSRPAVQVGLDDLLALDRLARVRVVRESQNPCYAEGGGGGGTGKAEEQPHALQKTNTHATPTEYARPTAELLSPVVQLCHSGAGLPNQLS